MSLRGRLCFPCTSALLCTLLAKLVLSVPLSRVDVDQEITHLTAEDFRRGQELTEDELDKSGDRQNAWIQRGKTGADYSGKAADFMKPGQTNRNGIKNERDKWANGQVPYVISTRYGQRARALIARSMQAYHEKTCIRFIPRTNERDYVYIAKIDGCFSDVGRAGGRQELSLDDECLEYDTAIHELMHAVGFWHEHERWDRNDFITILWQNIERDAYDQFGRATLFESDYYGEAYDYYSIMHYDSKSFSLNGQNTIEAKTPSMTQVIGRVKDFSPIDLSKLNKMYRCSAQPSQPTIPQQPAQPPPAVVDPWNQWPTVVQPNPVPFIPNPVQIPDTGCLDNATLCGSMLDRCRQAAFEAIMRQYCARSCGFCAPVG